MSNLSTMKIKLIGCLLLALVAPPVLHAQVRELWRNGVVNEPIGFFYSTTSALDARDNVIVGGMASFYGGVAPFVAKFDTRGQKLWEYFVGDCTADSSGGMECRQGCGR